MPQIEYSPDTVFERNLDRALTLGSWILLFAARAKHTAETVVGRTQKTLTFNGKTYLVEEDGFVTFDRSSDSAIQEFED